MKLKQHIVLTEPENFLKGDYHSCFSLYDSVEYLPDGWIDCGVIEIDINPDTGKMIEKVAADIDRKIETAKLAVTVLENQKRELLALTHQRTEDPDDTVKRHKESIEWTDMVEESHRDRP